MQGSSVIVVGAGVAGLCCALELSERGLRVEVVERATTLGPASCSWMAGGMLAPWCERATTEPEVVAWGAPSIAWWAERFAGTVRRGSLVVTPPRDLPELSRFASRTERYEWLDADRIAELEPDLAGRFRRALYFPDEAHLEPRRALAALADALAARGVPIRLGVELVPEQADADLVVDCRGLTARDALPDLRGVRGEMLVVRSRDVRLSRPVRLLHPRFPLYIVPRADGVCMIGATMIESEQRGPVTVRSAVDLLNAAFALHSGFGEAEIVELGADLRPAFPDNLPHVRREGRIIRANGLYRHGFLLAPWLARQVADSVLGAHIDSETVDTETGDADLPQRRRA
ncbi:MAG: glycine oxidase ThiO [Alphaproteobacteria bacterium]|nr:glycine oxidase ThiO [Alphaproteobacteria bacterium]